jgi:hypothetical protein
MELGLKAIYCALTLPSRLLAKITLKLFPDWENGLLVHSCVNVSKFSSLRCSVLIKYVIPLNKV